MDQEFPRGRVRLTVTHNGSLAAAARGVAGQDQRSKRSPRGRWEFQCDIELRVIIGLVRPPSPRAWLLLIIASPLAAILLINLLIAFQFYGTADDGKVNSDKTVLAAKDGPSFQILSDALHGGTYLTPRDYDLAVERSGGRIVKIYPGTSVHRKAERSYANRRSLTVKVEEDLLDGVTVWVPDQFRDSFTFCDKNCFP